MCPVCEAHGLTIVRARTVDYSRAQARADFQRARMAERAYATSLRHIARLIGQLVRAMDPSTFEGAGMIRSALETYSETLKPWARSVASKMIADVAARNKREWRKVSSTIGTDIQRQIDQTPVGAAFERLMAQQVDLITSLPREAAQRVHKLAMEAQVDGGRAKAIVAEIMRTGEVTKSRAELIARTEVGRASTVLTQVRAQAIGSDGYVWSGTLDGDERQSHRAMEGKFVRWDSPPTLDGLTGHAGSLPNCRCVCLPVVPDAKY